MLETPPPPAPAPHYYKLHFTERKKETFLKASS